MDGWKDLSKYLFALKLKLQLFLISPGTLVDEISEMFNLRRLWNNNTEGLLRFHLKDYILRVTKIKAKNIEKDSPPLRAFIYSIKFTKF